MITDQRILLTGGAGFIGSSLAARLVEKNQVVVFDSGHRDSLKDNAIAGHSNLRVIRGNVLDAGAVRSAMRDCDLVVHLAAIAGVDTVLQMPVTTMQVNIIGTYNVLEAARASDHKIDRLVDFSTSEVFGSYAYKVREADLTSLGAVGEALGLFLGLPLLFLGEWRVFHHGRVDGKTGDGAAQGNILGITYTDGSVGEVEQHRRDVVLGCSILLRRRH